jgi:hypothetical protein
VCTPAHQVHASRAALHQLHFGISDGIHKAATQFLAYILHTDLNRHCSYAYVHRSSIGSSNSRKLVTNHCWIYHRQTPALQTLPTPAPTTAMTTFSSSWTPEQAPTTPLHQLHQFPQEQGGIYMCSSPPTSAICQHDTSTAPTWWYPHCGFLRATARNRCTGEDLPD